MMIATSLALLPDLLRLVWSALCCWISKDAEILFLRKQLALFQERKIKPRRADDATRISMALLASLFDWRTALVVVKPQTLIRWHRDCYRRLWTRQSRPRGRPPLPQDIRRLIRAVASLNLTWGVRRIANELLLKLGLNVSHETIRKVLNLDPPTKDREPDQRWATFVRNHAQAIVACDLLTVVTARFRVLYVLVAMELGRRRILHINVTAHPTAQWTIQQLRETLPCDHSYRWLIHDRDATFSRDVDTAVKAMGIRPLRTPARAPKANSFCERLIGTIRRECLDYLIPLNERHLRHILTEWKNHYNRGRPHMALGPGIPDGGALPQRIAGTARHQLPDGYRVVAEPVLGGLHHEYRLEKTAA
jgi:putative transposase